MATNNVYRITYHWEKSGKRTTETLQANIIASATDRVTIFNVLNGNSKVPSGQTEPGLVIGSIEHLSDSVLS